jgi:hypothetical protein
VLHEIQAVNVTGNRVIRKQAAEALSAVVSGQRKVEFLDGISLERGNFPDNDEIVSYFLFRPPP